MAKRKRQTAVQSDINYISMFVAGVIMVLVTVAIGPYLMPSNIPFEDVAANAIAMTTTFGVFAIAFAVVVRLMLRRHAPRAVAVSALSVFALSFVVAAITWALGEPAVNPNGLVWATVGETGLFALIYPVGWAIAIHVAG